MPTEARAERSRTQEEKMPLAGRPVLAIDVTALINNPLTGIQRVILELVPRLARSCFARGMAVALVDSRDSVLRSLCHWDRPLSPEEIRRDLAAVASGGVVWKSRHLHWLVRGLGGAAWVLGKNACLGRVPGVRPLAYRLRGALRALLCRRRPSLDRADYYVSFSAGILPCRVPAELPPGRVVLVLHDLIPLHHSRYLRPEVTRAFAGNLFELAYGPRGPRGRFLTASAHVAREIRDLFWGLCRQEVPVGLVAWGYDRKTFYPDRDPDFRRMLRVPPGSFLALAVSTQDPRKRFGDIEAAVRLLSRRLPVHGVFIGQGPARRQKNIHYLGHVPDDLLRQAYSSCDVFVNWSAAEGFGLPVIEALACGARVIVPPDNPTLREVGGAGVLVAERATPVGLMQALASAARSPVLRHPRADLRRFDWDLCCRQIEEELWPAPVARRRAA